MKKVSVVAILLGLTIPVFCQRTREGMSTGTSISSINIINSGYRANSAEQFSLPLNSLNRTGLQSETPYSGLGGNGSLPFTNREGSFRSGQFTTPIRFRYQVVQGVSLQASSQMGGLTGIRQAKLGASVRLPRGINFTAGYGVGLSNMNRLGYGNRNTGLQFTAGYRLFGRK